jgi:hypothetical protein
MNEVDLNPVIIIAAKPRNYASTGQQAALVACKSLVYK